MKLCVLLIFHVLGDFVFQSVHMAEDKRKSGKKGRRALIGHLAIYTLTSFLAVCLWGAWWNVLLATLFLGVSHGVVDILFIRMGRAFPKRELPLFLIDQAAHLLLIYSTARLMGPLNGAGEFLRDSLFAGWQTQEIYRLALGVLLVLICTAPAAVLVKKVFCLIASRVPDEKRLEPARQVDVYRSGYVIGVCERLIIFILGAAGQFSAIGFVLAAKSLARFKLLNDDKDFAERYLVGTLVSALIALLCVLAWAG